jgi:hypothetical protein
MIERFEDEQDGPIYIVEKAFKFLDDLRGMTMWRVS